MTPPRAKPVRAWVVINGDDPFTPHLAWTMARTRVGTIKAFCAKADGGWRACRRLGYRIARVIVIEERK